ncbi:fibronectin type III domain-containing protein [uncultured Microscilla sp.]|uniref:fibronectin type III domain-containing protein n=1 Tax=uncultured Microscilla sp. TaxID=432653 RepID=UPI00261467A0|nr:fibronectin type III domain-containing protein [uncultured Microscilla sp.]
MKKNYTLSMWLLAAVLMLATNVGWAQVTLPHEEAFSYTTGANLSAQTNWTGINSGDEITVGSGNLSVNGLKTSTGGKISFAANGKDLILQTTEKTAGVVYYSFILKVTDVSSATKTAGGYLAGFASNNTTYGATVWLKKENTQYKVGINRKTSAGDTQFTTTNYNVGDVLFIVVSYDLDADKVNLWVNPNSSDFAAGTAPAVTLTTSTGGSLSTINRFFFRQDSGSETPAVEIDELRIATSWAAVTPAGTPAVTPTNHVTGVASSNVTVKGATINWTDATGANLPTGYIVQVKTSGSGDFPSFTDGVTVSDDVDFSDNSGVVSVGQGAQTVSLSGLTLGTNYEYRIVPYGGGTGGPKYKTDGTIPGGNFTTKTSVAVGVVKDFEDGSLTSGDWSVVSTVGAQVWTVSSSGADGSTKSAQISGFDSGSKDNTDWLISPPINFDATLKEQLNFFARQKFGTTDANNYLKVYYSTDYSGTGDPSAVTLNELNVTLPTTADVWASTGNIDLSAISGTAYIIFKYNSTDKAVRWNVDQIKIEIATILTTSLESLAGFGTNAGTASAVQTFDLTGATLSGDVTLTAPTGYEVSVDGGTSFGSPKTIAKAAIDGKTVTVQVRLAATAAEGVANGNLTIASTGATDKTVALAGLVAGATTPILSKSRAFAEFTNEAGTASASQYINVSGTRLTADIIATAPTGFEVSLDDNTFGNTVTLLNTTGKLADVKVYVRVAAATVAGAPSGNVTFTSTGATQLDVAVSAKVTTPVPVKTIKELRNKVDANGLPITKGTVRVKGVLHGVNTQTTNIAFTLIEGSNAAKEGIGLFINSSEFSKLNLADKNALTEGDELEIDAEVGHFNGLMQLTKVSKITKLGGSKALQTAAVVTTLSEDTESRLIKLENVAIKDKADWKGNASYSGSGFDVTIIVGEDTELELRIDGDTELAKKTYDEVFEKGATSGITIVGIGGQFDSSDPRDSGYQIGTWKTANITVDLSKAKPNAPTLNAATDITNGGFTASWAAATQGATADSYLLDVSTDSKFTALVVGFANLSVTGTSQVVTGLSAGTKYYVRVKAVNANGASQASNVGIVTTTGATTGVNAATDITFKTFPNPTSGSLVIESNTYKFSKVIVTTLSSKLMIKKNLQGAHKSNIDLSNLGQGVYLVQIFDNQNNVLSVRRIVKR